MSGLNELQTRGNGDYGMNSSHIAQYGATDAGTHWKKIGKVKGAASAREGVKPLTKQNLVRSGGWLLGIVALTVTAVLCRSKLTESQLHALKFGASSANTSERLAIDGAP